MKMLTYLLVILLCSCAAKRKLKESNSTTLKQSLQVQRIREQKASSQIYQVDSAAIQFSHWLKIYPKGEIQVGRNGFVGLADSLIWYGSGQQTNHSERMAKTSQDLLLSEDVSHTESYLKEATRKGLTKLGPSFGLVVVGMGVILVFLFLYHKFKR